LGIAFLFSNLGIRMPVAVAVQYYTVDMLQILLELVYVALVVLESTLNP
jgi:hypothetical protein